jgi:hypothetical protein
MKNFRGAILGTLFFLLSFQPAGAGFGITPPYVKNDSLARDSVYTQRVVISRSDPVEDLRADVTVNVPGADEWIAVDRGLSFILPKGESQVPIQI